MQSWLNFWNLFFWLFIFSFYFGGTNFIKVLLFSEVIWIFSYTYFLVTGTVNDDLTLLSTSILILGLAGLEFSIGLILIVLFKNTFKTIVFKKKNWNLQQNNKKLSMRKYQWKS